MRILVFGSNGLVGANLKDVLNQTSHQNFFQQEKTLICLIMKKLAI